MYYEVFPFGKYKGVKLNELPSTYIVLALEQFDLPKELVHELFHILLSRFGVFSLLSEQFQKKSKKECLEWLNNRVDKYEIKL